MRYFQKWPRLSNSGPLPPEKPLEYYPARLRGAATTTAGLDAWLRDIEGKSKNQLQLVATRDNSLQLTSSQTPAEPSIFTREHQCGPQQAHVAEKIVMLDTQSELARLRERVEQLERQRAKTNRGHVNQKRAAEYLNKSREWLRLREIRGDGPVRNPDKSYSLDNLDAYTERNSA